jgi:hypothetical protein
MVVVLRRSVGVGYSRSTLLKYHPAADSVDTDCWCQLLTVLSCLHAGKVSHHLAFPVHSVARLGPVMAARVLVRPRKSWRGNKLRKSRTSNSREIVTSRSREQDHAEKTGKATQESTSGCNEDDNSDEDGQSDVTVSPFEEWTAWRFLQVATLVNCYMQLGRARIMNQANSLDLSDQGVTRPAVYVTISALCPVYFSPLAIWMWSLSDYCTEEYKYGTKL